MGTFVENLAVLDDGAIAVAVHSDNAIERIERDGRRSVLAQLPAPPAGLVEHEGGLYVACGIPGESPGRIFHIDAAGRLDLIVEIADALFLNGMTPWTGYRLLAVDSLLGRVYAIDVKARRASVWFEHELLKKITSFPMMPGVNGIKRFGDGVYVTNTDRAIVLCIPVEADDRPGPIRVVAVQLRGDDFAFDMDGSAYIATHVENTLVKLSRDGERVSIAGPDQGMPGSTAAAFGRHAEDLTSLYVTTTGGLVAPYRRVLEEAKLIRLQVGVAGHPIALQEAQGVS